MKPLIMVCLLALVQPALAQNSAAPPANPNDGSAPAAQSSTPPATPHRMRFEDADTDHDGKLSRSEAQALPFVSKHFDEIDTDHDGYVTRDEFKAFRQAQEKLKAQRAGQQGMSGGAAPQQQGAGNANPAPATNGHG